MRSLLSILTLFILIACTPSPEVTSGSSSKEINSEAPFIWGNKAFPKTVHISTSFTAKENLAITRMATAWKTAVTNQKTFFSFGDPGNNNYNLVKTDGVMGIYKATTWPADIPDALAITQLFGRRYNIGQPNEHVSIVEADILMNYKVCLHCFTYDVLDGIEDDGADDDAGYDLRTVMLHEMGHFLGLQHITYWDDLSNDEQGLYDDRDEYKATSVMYPSITASEEKRVPQTLDINTLVNKYNIGGGAPAMVAGASRFVPNEGDPGKNVKIVIELKASGECVHKEDGAVIRRHHIKLK